MDPQGTAMMNRAGVYNFGEIWPAFQMGVGATSYGFVMDPIAADADQRSSSCTANQSSRNECPKSEGIKRLKPLESNDSSANEEGEMNPEKAVEQSGKSAEAPKQDYIHVRARRGQATDSHSLAERARREKISERMRILQDLVPGCNKVIGKALVLNEIINYIQSLQRQVEFLSMKLEAVSSRVGVDEYHPKDFAQQNFDASNIAFGSRDHGRGSSPEWLHMQIGGGFEPPP